MIPKEGAAFLAPLFGNWAGKDDITSIFSRILLWQDWNSR